MSVGKEVVAVAFVRPQAWGRTGADALPLPQGTKPVLHDSLMPPPLVLLSMIPVLRLMLCSCYDTRTWTRGVRFVYRIE